jgi:hypothetical protein
MKSIVASLLLASASCGGAPAVGPLVATITPWPQNWSALLGQKVTLEGEAVNAKLGAMLMHGEDAIWIADKDSWPDGFYQGGDHGRLVRVTGIVIERLANICPKFGRANGPGNAGGVGRRSAAAVASIFATRCGLDSALTCKLS